MGNDVQVEVRRSARRSRTVSASRSGEVIVVSIPARFSPAQEEEWVAAMVERVLAAEARRRRSSADLEGRAAELGRRYLDDIVRPTSVRWVTNQNLRWGSCTPRDGTIRISARLKEVPGWVLDYVLLHELAHLMEHNHGPRFWALLERYPRAERARGYLEGLTAAGFLPGSSPEADGSDETDEIVN